MTGSSPGDLAVAYHSLVRRRRSALGDTSPDDAAPLLRRLDELVRQAALMVGVAADPDAIGAAIEGRPADTWGEDELESLRANALAIGHALRDLEALGDDQ